MLMWKLRIRRVWPAVRCLVTNMIYTANALAKIFATSIYAARNSWPYNVEARMQARPGHLPTISAGPSLSYLWHLLLLVFLFVFYFQFRNCVTAAESEREWDRERVKWLSLACIPTCMWGILGLWSDILINCILACWNGPTCNSFSCLNARMPALD